MKLLSCLFFLLLLGACERSKPKDTEPSTPDPRLLAKYETYVALAGSVDENDCDWLLFASLNEAGGGKAADPERARGSNGQWYRTPAQDCYPDRSGSTISRDMFLGLFWWALVHDRRDVLEQVQDYGALHGWVMGEGELSRTVLTPNIQLVLADLIREMGGKDYNPGRFEPDYPPVTGYEAHLSAIIVGLRAVSGSGSEMGYDAARKLVSRQPRNAFFQAVLGLYTGDQTAATELLLNEAWWPADRLPTSADRCEPWLTQRDEGESWLPCPDENLTHSGGDFMIAAALALGKATKQ